MKNIKSFESFLFENKNIGYLYHFTNVSSLEGILSEDRMESSAIYNYISLSRNPKFNTETKGFRGKNIRIMFDGSRLSDKFHIEPYLYNPAKDTMYGSTEDWKNDVIALYPEYKDYKNLRKDYGSEREERIIGDKEKDGPIEIKGIIKYILSVELDNSKVTDEKYKKAYEKLFVEYKKMFPNIDFEIVNNFKYPVQKHFKKVF